MSENEISISRRITAAGESERFARNLIAGDSTGLPQWHRIFRFEER